MGNSSTKSKRLTVCTIALLLIATSIPLMLGCTESNPPHNPLLPVIEGTLAKGGPVKDDLIKRGLFTMSTVSNNSAQVSGSIKLGEIQKLVDTGVYAIDEDGYLVFGPIYTPLP